jgi:hypothetical protein
VQILAVMKKATIALLGFLVVGCAHQATATQASDPTTVTVTRSNDATAAESPAPNTTTPGALPPRDRNGLDQTGVTEAMPAKP